MRKVGERAVLFANLSRAIFTCPNCGLETSYTEREVSADGVCCRSCKRFFLPLTFHKADMVCAACERRLEEVCYREGAVVHRFCRDCAAQFDSLVAQAESEYRKWLRGIVSIVRAARRLRQTLTRPTTPSRTAATLLANPPQCRPARLVSAASRLQAASEAGKATLGITPFWQRLSHNGA